MRNSRTIALLLVVLLATTALSGCKRKTDDTSSGETTTETVTTETTEPTETLEPEGSDAADAADDLPVPSDVIHSPAKGSAERTAILDGVRAYQKSDDLYIVHQLRVKGRYAVADLELPDAYTGWRIHVAVMLDDGAWLVQYSGDAFDGKPDLTLAEFSLFPPELLNAIDWILARRDMERLAGEVAIPITAAEDDLVEADMVVNVFNLARTSGHEWWCSVLAVSKTTMILRPTIVFMKWRPDGPGWEFVFVGRADIVDPATDPRLPVEVRPYL